MPQKKKFSYKLCRDFSSSIRFFVTPKLSYRTIFRASRQIAERNRCSVTWRTPRTFKNTVKLKEVPNWADFSADWILLGDAHAGLRGHDHDIVQGVLKLAGSIFSPEKSVEWKMYENMFSGLERRHTRKLCIIFRRDLINVFFLTNFFFSNFKFDQKFYQYSESFEFFVKDFFFNDNKMTSNRRRQSFHPKPWRNLIAFPRNLFRPTCRQWKSCS